MSKYRVVTKCEGCGSVYTSRAKDKPTSPTRCKHCESYKTRAIKARKVK